MEDDPDDDMAKLPPTLKVKYIIKDDSGKFGRERYDGNFYHSGEWKRFRKAYKLKHPPVCVECGWPARYLDHIVPISMGGEALDEDNVQWLCVRHNAIKTNRDRMKKNR